MENYNQQNILAPWAWCYLFDEESLWNISLICIWRKERRPLKCIRCKLGIYSGSPYAGAGMAKSEITPRFIFVHGE